MGRADPKWGRTHHSEEVPGSHLAGRYLLEARTREERGARAPEAAYRRGGDWWYKGSVETFDGDEDEDDDEDNDEGDGDSVDTPSPTAAPSPGPSPH
eukprot:CAMPEP_0118979374 /NCGR_PEP_ID=MMETSP1173-20130426/25821_1 /TAXON_ID=1034831 /ORGANISM="Rhizochromulina marina cf, Strain CCMP1243" /LENGTH=96 /DNA_ID=CAMNT_0006929631 /DNA_START=42 /DNA_END=329 /DNA_ORIENTATION=-